MACCGGWSWRAAVEVRNAVNIESTIPRISQVIGEAVERGGWLKNGDSEGQQDSRASCSGKRPSRAWQLGHHFEGIDLDKSLRQRLGT